jgi:predicted ArsR family transcriptional regulator
MADRMVSPARMRIMRLLVGRPPQTVANLMAATQVTRTAVTEQLNELVAAGFVEQGTERLSGRGRPRHVYSATTAALIELFTNHEHFVVSAIWKAIAESGGAELTEEILRRVAHELADRYMRRITVDDPRKRFIRFAELLDEEGTVVEVAQRDGHVVMQKLSCPFISMLDENRSVCSIDQAMMDEIVGRPVRRTGYRHAGAPCCTFELDGNA